jgi:hypothetical protein
MNDLSDKKCTAVLTNGTRCNRTVTQGTYHCGLHNDKAMKLRAKYKKIWNKIYNVEIENTSDISELMKSHAIMRKAFEARSKHRQYAFVPECHDDAHNYQFDLVQNKMNQCEKKLAILYQKSNRTIVPNDETESSDEENGEVLSRILQNGIVLVVFNSPKMMFPPNKTFSSKTALQIAPKNQTETRRLSKISKNRIHQTRIKLENEAMDRYIRVNKLVELYSKKDEIEKMDLADPILDNVWDMSNGKSKYEDKDLLVLATALDTVLFHLGRINYFSPDYYPKKCKYWDCNDYCESFTLTGLYCGIHPIDSILKHPALLVDLFFDYDKEDLIKLNDLLSNQKKKIQPILQDLELYYTLHGTQILFSPYSLAFNSVKQRMVLSQTAVEKLEPISKQFARDRIKKKLKNQSIRTPNKSAYRIGESQAQKQSQHNRRLRRHPNYSPTMKG